MSTLTRVNLFPAVMGKGAYGAYVEQFKWGSTSTSFSWFSMESYADQTIPKLRRQLIRAALLIIDDLGISGTDAQLGPFSLMYRSTVSKRFASHHQPVSAGQVVRLVRCSDNRRCDS